VPDWITQVTAFTVFLAIGAVGFVFLLVSLVFGEIFGHFDHSFDHPGEHGGVSILSTRVLSVFITAFGGFGALASNAGYGLLPSSGVGFASGVVFGGMIYYFARFLFSQQASTEVRATDIAGREARVVVAIPANGIGQVRVQIGEELVDKVAKTADGSAIAVNSIVKIQQALGEMVVVKAE